MEPEMLFDFVGDLGALGFVLWLARHLTTRTIPALTSSFATALDDQRNDFGATLDKQRADFAALHNRECTAHDERLQAVIDKCVHSTGRQH